MPTLKRMAGPACSTILLLSLLAACGDDTRLPQAAGATAFSAASVTITQQGNADVSIDNASVVFALDGTRSLVVRLRLTSHASAPVNITLRASLYDKNHNLVGDAVGGQINVQPGQPSSVQLAGPTPLGTIASAVFEASSLPAPT